MLQLISLEVINNSFDQIIIIIIIIIISEVD